MIRGITSILNEAVTALPVGVRVPFAEVIDGVPSRHAGGGQFVPVINDAAGGVSYWRANGTQQVTQLDATAACGDAVRVSVPVALVGFVRREQCDAPDALLNAAAHQIRASLRAVRDSIQGAFAVNVTGLSMGVDIARTNEVRDFVVPSSLVVLTMSFVIHVDASSICLDQCGEPYDLTCKVIERASNAKVEECLGPDRIAEICGGGGPCADVTIRTTDGSTTVGTAAAGTNYDVPQSVIKYTDAANAAQVTAAADTEYSGSTLRPATVVPRRELFYIGGTGTGLYATVDRLIADTIPQVPIPATPLNVLHEYTTGGTWNKPSSYAFKGVWVLAVGGGGGGGAGRDNTNTRVSGGSGGGGCMVLQWIPAASLGSTETYSIGAGGTGGVGALVVGTAGGYTTFGAHVVSRGGSGGTSATSTPSDIGIAANCTPARGPWATNGGARSTTANAGAAGPNGNFALNGATGAASGGTGGPWSLASGAFGGGSGGGAWDAGSFIAGPTGGSVGGGAGGNGADNQAVLTILDAAATIGMGTAGSGGGANAAGNGGNGGNGGLYGAGGGGGGSANGGTAGNGGDGAQGCLLVLEVY